MDAAILQTLRVICTEGNVRKLALYLGDGDVPDAIGQDDAVFNML
ncbi:MULTISPECIES: hypothetical protein [unclassified Streptomyces]|nr:MULTISPECIES: hypothetical protein [unclassified Streptomyces]